MAGGEVVVHHSTIRAPLPTTEVPAQIAWLSACPFVGVLSDVLGLLQSALMCTFGRLSTTFVQSMLIILQKTVLACLKQWKEETEEKIDQLRRAQEGMSTRMNRTTSDRPLSEKFDVVSLSCAEVVLHSFRW